MHKQFKYQLNAKNKQLISIAFLSLLFIIFVQTSVIIWHRFRQSNRTQFLMALAQSLISYGKFVGLIFFSSYFTIMPKIFVLILPWILDTIPKYLIMIVSLASIYAIVLLTYNISTYFIYTMKISFFQRYRINNVEIRLMKKPWPWEVNSQQWRKLFLKSIKNVIINGFIINPILILGDAYKTPYTYQVEQIPSLFTHIWQFVFFLLVDELFFYFIHRALHHPKLYWIHKEHHEYNTTASMAAEHSHVIQSIVNAISFASGFRILILFCPVHVITICIWLAFRIVQACDAHSGYEWSWSQSAVIPFSAGFAFHNFHHSHNVGNYSAFFGFLDSLLGTNVDFIKFRAKQEKEQLKEYSYQKQK